jgi:hypothetical protein
VKLIALGYSEKLNSLIIFLDSETFQLSSTSFLKDFISESFKGGIPP